MEPLDDDKPLDEARAMFPDWDIHEVLGGYIAVPAGTPVVRGMFAATIIEKLRVMQGQLVSCPRAPASPGV